jgi:hypothetical protein
MYFTYEFIIARRRCSCKEKEKKTRRSCPDFDEAGEKGKFPEKQKLKGALNKIFRKTKGFSGIKNAGSSGI